MERAAKRWKTGAMLKWSLSAYRGVTLLGAGSAPCKTFTRAGNLHELEAAASSPCQVVRARGVRVTC